MTGNKFQLIICNESNLSKLLEKDHVCKTKIFFEGDGLTLDVKYSDPVIVGKGARVFVTCNDLYTGHLSKND